MSSTTTTTVSNEHNDDRDRPGADHNGRNRDPAIPQRGRVRESGQDHGVRHAGRRGAGVAHVHQPVVGQQRTRLQGAVGVPRARQARRLGARAAAGAAQRFVGMGPKLGRDGEAEPVSHRCVARRALDHGVQRQLDRAVRHRRGRRAGDTDAEGVVLRACPVAVTQPALGLRAVRVRAVRLLGGARTVQRR